MVYELRLEIQGNPKGWKLLNRAVAVRESLVKRGLHVGILCPMCPETKSIEHMLLECVWVHRVWEDLLGLTDPRDGCCSIGQWLSKRRNDKTGSRSGGVTRWQLVLTGCWQIWKSMCAALHEGRAPVPAQVVIGFRRSVIELSLPISQHCSSLHTQV